VKPSKVIPMSSTPGSHARDMAAAAAGGATATTAAATAAAASSSASASHARHGHPQHPRLHRKGQISLPDETRLKLSELHRDYVNDELTEKGYKIRKGKVLTISASVKAFCQITETKSKSHYSRPPHFSS